METSAIQNHGYLPARLQGSKQEAVRYLNDMYKQCLDMQSKFQENLKSVNARLAKIDPKFIGEERIGSTFKFYLRRLSKNKEVSSLKKIKKINTELSAKYSERMKAVESELHKFVQSDIRSERFFPKLFKWDKTKSVEEMAPLPVKSPEENRKALLDFLGKLTVFQESPHLRQELELQFPLSDKIQIRIKNENTVEIECPKLKVRIDPTLPVSREACRRIDPSNPLLQTKEPITVGDLTQYGSIDSEWWEWLKVKKYPSFGPRIVLKREGNTLTFVKGASLLDAISFTPKGISFKAMCFEKVCDWKAEDFIGFLSTFNSYKG